jgi:glycosyltransferase involved in cell wall biosynthesis
MRIFHFNTYFLGGAAATALRLHEGLLASGIKSIAYTRLGTASGNRKVYRDCYGRGSIQMERLQKRFARSILRGPYNLFTFSNAPADTPFPEDLIPGDVVHLHWVNHWLDLTTFLQSIPPFVPIVWSAHDIALVTGGCHMYRGCEGFTSNCRRCPILKPPFDRFLASRELDIRRRLLQKHSHAFVGNSKWTTELIRRSSISSEAAVIETIPPSINSNEWIAYPKSEAKRLLGIPPGTKVVGFGAAELTDTNKNTAGCLSVLSKVAEKEPIEALFFGDGAIDTTALPFRVRFAGNISDPALLSICYSAMDVLLVTSFIETFGLVAVEAQACGTPVAAYGVGGLTDAVYSEGRPTLVPLGAEGALADVVIGLLQDQTMAAEHAMHASVYVRSHFDSGQAVLGYRSLYERMLQVTESNDLPPSTEFTRHHAGGKEIS